ncbi:High mobility group HMG1/HMG2 [Venturia nashicola]|uniref:Ataxin-10 homolog n=1 Tax=Venturia nashicola TaxID=86259 RepID=A0A4Z1NWX6_9PEZI|nr:High mobility group HMG1/HMG2 [Venturia nashicola]
MPRPRHNSWADFSYQVPFPNLYSEHQVARRLAQQLEMDEPLRYTTKAPPAQPHATLFRLGLQPLIVHFKSMGNGYMDPATMDNFDNKILRRLLQDTAREAEVREQLAVDPNVWNDMHQTLEAAIACLTETCFNYPKPPGQTTDEAENALAALLVTHYASLMKDVGRVNNLLGIGRNILTIGNQAQKMAGKKHVDEGVLKLVTICIKITLRGGGGATTKEDDKKIQSVVNDFKKLLIACLQFLNNLIAQNERRKLMLWIELFDCPADGNGSVQGPAIDRSLLDSFRDDPIMNGHGHNMAEGPTQHSMREGVPHVIERFKDGLVAHMNRINDRSSGGKQSVKDMLLDKEHLNSSPFLLYIGRVGMDIKKELHDAGKPAGATEIAAECKRRWQSMTKEEQKSWYAYYNELLTRYRDEFDHAGEELQKKSDERDAESSDTPSAPTNVTESNGEVAESFPKASILDHGPAAESDYKITYTAEQGADVLRQGKEDLMRQLEPEADRPVRSRRMRMPPPPDPANVHDEDQSHPDPPDAPLALASDDGRDLLDEESEEEEEDDSDYDDPIPGDFNRGLLTDIPLILGPQEVEVLPMIIQTGIVPPGPNQPGYGRSPEEVAAIKNMHTVRCHLLLAQDNGRNLLRELLIFVAAWDLREDELYFKLMIQIIEAVLTNGLLPFSYHAFRESKDIVSPAQAVMMKFLTNIFRSRQADTARRAGLSVGPQPNTDSLPKLQPYPQRVDVHMVSFLFTEFRQHIIPRTCALIFLQGQIRNGMVAPDEFPLNLWDMERMYEGIYQYLEFFAILTEHDVWKQMMADWKITSELITLLEELDSAIPRSTPRHQAMKNKSKTAPINLPSTSEQEPKQPVAVERPYDIQSSPSPPNLDPLMQPENTSTTAPDPTHTPLAPIHPHEDEPSDFEWRNLKKLAVLVLSSLVWKSRAVQDQLYARDERAHPGRGVRALLNCCKYDDYNPFIREHAIMALRFALEGHAGNQDVVRGLEKLGKERMGKNGVVEGYDLDRGVDVPREVLDLNGYETFVDGRGQVQLKKRDGVAIPVRGGKKPEGANEGE